MEIKSIQKVISAQSGLQADDSERSYRAESTELAKSAPFRANGRSVARRFRKETFCQKNIDEVRPVPQVRKCSVNSASSNLKCPRPIDIALVVLFLAKLEVILVSIEDDQIKPIKGAVIELRRDILSIQQELVYNRAMIEKLQSEVELSREAEVRLNEAIENNRRLLSDLQNRFAQHDNLILQLQNHATKHEAFSQELSEAIADNKKIIAQMQNAIHDIEELENILIKYGNNADGLPAIHAAIKNGDKRAVELLIEHGADVNARMVRDPAKGNAGLTALNFAVLERKEDIVRLLLDKGADVNGGLVTTYVDQWDKKEKINTAKTSIHFAAETGDVKILKLLLERGAAINQDIWYHPPQTNHFCTPLHIAAQNGQFDAVVALVELGAIVNIGLNKGNYAYTPLDHAAQLKYSDDPKNLELVKFLVEHGAQRNRRQENIPCPVIKAYLGTQHR